MMEQPWLNVCPMDEVIAGLPSSQGSAETRPRLRSGVLMVPFRLRRRANATDKRLADLLTVSHSAAILSILLRSGFGNWRGATRCNAPIEIGPGIDNDGINDICNDERKPISLIGWSRSRFRPRS